ncbi:Hypothetical_protein [Hexamita inflata]|uniref:Hypothetical_protein n=1 Tax=Hexamita inflata TaxID=28002 RepID=A0AA86NA47_9EUKA|nr:Hypothetical protein HINF_LOCUS3502 [Hexamita inflata]
MYVRRTSAAKATNDSGTSIQGRNAAASCEPIYTGIHLRHTICVSKEAMERLPLSNPEGSLMTAQHFESGDFTVRNRFGRAASQIIGCGEEREAQPNESIIDHTKQSWYFSNASSALTSKRQAQSFIYIYLIIHIQLYTNVHCQIFCLVIASWGYNHLRLFSKFKTCQNYNLRFELINFNTRFQLQIQQSQSVNSKLIFNNFLNDYDYLHLSYTVFSFDFQKILIMIVKRTQSCTLVFIIFYLQKYDLNCQVFQNSEEHSRVNETDKRVMTLFSLSKKNALVSKTRSKMFKCRTNLGLRIGSFDVKKHYITINMLNLTLQQYYSSLTRR